MRYLVAVVFGVLVSPVLAAGGPPPVEFDNVIGAVGLDGYRGQTAEGHGPGLVFTDLDNDGYADIYLSRAWGDSANQLYRNVAGVRGARVFVRAVNDAGAGETGRASGTIAGDYDNDGDVDLYVANFDGPNALLQNQLMETGVLSFVDVTASTDPTPGVVDDQYGVATSWYEGIELDNSLTAAWGDPDRDGDLDLFVGCHNGFFGTPIEGPFNIPGRRDTFYLNNGDGTFSDVTMAYDVPGFRLPNGDYGTVNQRFSSTNAVIFVDLDNDRWPDLLVTNKIGGPDDRDMLYMNKGADEVGNWLGFELVTWDLSPTFGHQSGAAMGVDVGDLDRDGDLDLYFTDWNNLETGATGRNDLWVNQLIETGTTSFVHESSMRALYSWGTQLQDFDQNGWLDVHVGVQAPGRDFLYMYDADGVTEVAEQVGMAQTLNARGVASADYNRDGWTDLFVVIIDDAPSILYENKSAATYPDRHWITLKLVGDPSTPAPYRSTRDAIGARVNVVGDLNGDGALTADERLLREVVSGSSNAVSTSSLELEVGLDKATDVGIEVLWPSGRRSVVQVSTNAFIVLDEASLVLGDLDANGAVGFNDLSMLLAKWGPCAPSPALCAGDLDGDGLTTFADLVLMLANWG